MKKVFSFSILLIYFAVSTGFVVNLHYCMNRFHSWELGHSDKDLCSECGMETGKSNGCCHDEVKVIKLQQDLVKAHSLIYDINAPTPLVAEHASFYFNAAFLPPRMYIPPAHGPPPLSAPPQYLLNRVFRI